MQSFKRLNRCVAAIWVMVGVLVTSCATAAPVGEFDFNELDKQYGNAKVEANLGRGLLSLVGAVAGQDDPELAQILQDVSAVQVRVYNLAGKPELALKNMESFSAKMRRAHWEPLVSVNDGTAKVRLFSRLEGDKMQGLVVMVLDAADAGEAVFINVVGSIDPAKVGQLVSVVNAK